MIKDNWIKELAMNDQTHDEGALASNSEIADPRNYKRELFQYESYSFLNSLRGIFDRYARLFNQYRNNQLNKVKLFGIANSKADFMLFRNGVKLVFTFVSEGKISCHYIFAPSLGQASQNALDSGITLEMTSGPFNSVMWTYQGHKVDSKSFVRYCMTDFIRNSAR